MTDSAILKVNYGDMPGMNKKTQLFFKNLEWGINIKSNTMYLTYEIEQDTLYAVMTRFDNFVQHNEDKDIKLSNKQLTKISNDIINIVFKSEDDYEAEYTIIEKIKEVKILIELFFNIWSHDFHSNFLVI